MPESEKTTEWWIAHFAGNFIRKVALDVQYEKQLDNQVVMELHIQVYEYLNAIEDPYRQDDAIEKAAQAELYFLISLLPSENNPNE